MIKKLLILVIYFIAFLTYSLMYVVVTLFAVFAFIFSKKLADKIFNIAWKFYEIKIKNIDKLFKK